MRDLREASSRSIVSHIAHDKMQTMTSTFLGSALEVKAARTQRKVRRWQGAERTLGDSILMQ